MYCSTTEAFTSIPSISGKRVLLRIEAYGKWCYTLKSIAHTNIASVT
jgi:hypothetical protein